MNADPRYNPKEYWAANHQRHGASLHSVGHRGLSEEKNAQMYAQANQVLRDNFADLITDKKVVDIGCGIGMYTHTCLDLGCSDYWGVDIAMHEAMKGVPKELLGQNFMTMDITEDELPCRFDTALMLDVTQHIVDPERFDRAMEHIEEKCDALIVTSHLSKDFVRYSSYEVFRPMHAFTEHFKGWVFTLALQFRDKWIFSVERHA